mmetsp:Transcript_4898/g.9112  ORF Transcript_4898/g.9112 Transcript_4898/m.9112 type:complete len:130 (+) Transcript_4898:336-725(+)
MKSSWQQQSASGKGPIDIDGGAKPSESVPPKSKTVDAIIPRAMVPDSSHKSSISKTTLDVTSSLMVTTQGKKYAGAAGGRQRAAPKTTFDIQNWLDSLSITMQYASTVNAGEADDASTRAIVDLASAPV